MDSPLCIAYVKILPVISLKGKDELMRVEKLVSLFNTFIALTFLEVRFMFNSVSISIYYLVLYSHIR